VTATEEKQGADLTPLEQAAILLLSVGEANAARILRHLGPKEVQKVGAQMASMGDIEARDVSRVMERLLLEANTASGLGVGTESYIRNVLIEGTRRGACRHADRSDPDERQDQRAGGPALDESEAGREHDRW
jgi:hypothetical protein